MHFSTTLVIGLAVLAIVQACPGCGGKCGCGCGGCCKGCGGAQCLPAPSPYDAIGVALGIPGPCVPNPCIPCCPPPCCVIPKCGPGPSPIQVFQAPSITVPGPCAPVIEFPNPCLPPPRVIAHKAVVSKAVMKPQVYQRIVRIPIMARFLKKSVGNVVENICYQATPKCCGPEGPVPMVCCNCRPQCSCGCGCFGGCGCC